MLVIRNHHAQLSLEPFDFKILGIVGHRFHAVKRIPETGKFFDASIPDILRSSLSGLLSMADSKVPKVFVGSHHAP